MIQIILVRHGRTAWNAGETQGARFRGTVDLPLAPEGVDQARTTARRLAGLSLSAIYSSPLQRAAHTARILARPHDLEVQIVPGLSSMDYGQWAGLLRTEVARRWPDLYRGLHHDLFAVRAPDGESFAELRERALAAVRHILARHARTGGDGTILLVSHQVVARSLLCGLVGLPNQGYWLIRQSLCNLTRFEYHPEVGRLALSGMNDTCHLDPALPRTTGGSTRLILVRHGQTAWNVGAGPERFRGRADLPLDSVGQAQAAALAARLAGEPIAAIYASPLQRTRQTVAPLAARLGLEVEPHDGLLDIDYGRFQGLDHDEAAAAYPEQYRQWRTAPGKVRFPGGEGLTDLQARLRSLLAALAGAHPDQTVVLAGHQIVNKTLACTLLGLDLDQIWRIGQDPACANVHQQVTGSWHTLRLNDTCHLDGLDPSPAQTPRPGP
ncbi:MAG: histidine phosphatase family protein [Anaerolineae bacterium]|jgi:probable phosphoglycerate mutase